MSVSRIKKSDTANSSKSPRVKQFGGFPSCRGILPKNKNRLCSISRFSLHELAGIGAYNPVQQLVFAAEGAARRAHLGVQSWRLSPSALKLAQVQCLQGAPFLNAFSDHCALLLGGCPFWGEVPWPRRAGCPPSCARDRADPRRGPGRRAAAGPPPSAPASGGG